MAGASLDGSRRLEGAALVLLLASRNVDDIQPQLTRVRSELDEPHGPLGRYRRDSTLTAAIAGAHQDMSALLSDIKKHPLRYISF